MRRVLEALTSGDYVLEMPVGWIIDKNYPRIVMRVSHASTVVALEKRGLIEVARRVSRGYTEHYAPEIGRYVRVENVRHEYRATRKGREALEAVQ